MDNLDRLMYFTGVAADYHDYSGQFHSFDRELRCRVLTLCGYNIEDPEAVDAAVYQIDAAPWRQWLRPFMIIEQGQPIPIHCSPDSMARPLSLKLSFEMGGQRQQAVVPQELTETGEYWIGDVRYSRRAAQLADLPLGYHQLSVTDLSGHCENATLVVCPVRAYQPASGANRKVWGVGCQLYSLRSDRNHGIGDFSDLKVLIKSLASLGADFVALNPLHALCNDENTVSPYSPSDRRFLNPLYISLQEVPQWSSQYVQKKLRQHDLEAVGEALRQEDYIDYSAVARFKFQILYWFFQGFKELSASDSEQLRFAEFVNSNVALQGFAEYELNNNCYLPSEAQDPTFICYLQWLAHEQLSHCQQYAIACGMETGLLGDLAVGSVGAGFEAVSQPSLFLPQASIGAPPDPFADQGQNWGLPVVNPVEMKRTHFHHFIQLLRENMKHCGALRVDHAMSMMRLWWCLNSNESSGFQGIYVYYPMDDLINLLKLESVRSRCAIVAEDLGVVPESFREKMAASGLLANNLFYFDQYCDQYLTPPHAQQVDALLMITNHDVPTLKDWWDGSDLLRRQSLGLIVSDDELQSLRVERTQEKQKILDWLHASKRLPEHWSEADAGREFDAELCEAIHVNAASGRSVLMMLQLEDLQLMTEPVNIPGTHLEYPNWRRKQKYTLEDIFQAPRTVQLLGNVARARSHD